MPHPQLDRSQLLVRRLNTRPNKVEIERDAVSPDAVPQSISRAAAEALTECVAKIRAARNAGRPVMLAFGAHTIKNGLAPVLIQLMEQGWVTLLATNGAGIIHDWEFAFQGLSSEDVRANVDQGQFGIWEETGFNLNLALVVGAYEGIGYGEAVGKMIYYLRYCKTFSRMGRTMRYVCLPLPFADAGRGFCSTLAIKQKIEPIYYEQIKTAKPLVLRT